MSTVGNSSLTPRGRNTPIEDGSAPSTAVSLPTILLHERVSHSCLSASRPKISTTCAASISTSVILLETPNVARGANLGRVPGSWSYQHEVAEIWTEQARATLWGTRPKGCRRAAVCLHVLLARNMLVVTSPKPYVTPVATA